MHLNNASKPNFPYYTMHTGITVVELDLQACNFHGYYDSEFKGKNKSGLLAQLPAHL